MSAQSYILLAVMGVFALVTVFVCYKSGRFVKNLFLSALSGIGAILAVNLMTDFTAVSVPLNPITLAVGAFFGISGVIGIIVTQILI